MRHLLPEFIKRPLRGAVEARRLWSSQAGQDFWVFGEAFNEKRGGYFLDIGAHDGVEISNTVILERRYGWRGICVEANPVTFSKLARNRSAVCVNACLDAEERDVRFATNDVLGGIVDADTDNRPDALHGSFVSMRTRRLDDVLREHGAPAVIDYLSIDVEGAEDRVLLDFPFDRYRVLTMTVERPSRALQAKLASAGMQVVKQVPGLDTFFVHESFSDTYAANVFSFYSKRVVFANLS